LAKTNSAAPSQELPTQIQSDGMSQATKSINTKCKGKMSAKTNSAAASQPMPHQTQRGG
jgi:hypothetical protein